MARVIDSAMMAERPDKPTNPSDGLPDSKSEKFAAAGLALLIFYAAIRGIFAAAARPLWYDELCTRIVALQPSMRAIQNALLQGADGLPPAYYIVERAASALLRNEQIAFRLPSILGFCCALLCLFVFVRRRSGGICALVCAAIPTLSILFTLYAIEARSYALLVGLVAVALVCYQRAPAGWWVLLMGLSLVAAEAMHYYAVFAILPFAIAEFVVLVATRRIRFGVWLAFACAGVPLALSWKLVQALKQVYGAHFWSPASLIGAIQIYTGLFRFNGVLGFALTVSLIAGLLAIAAAEKIWEVRERPEMVAKIQEYALTCALVALPLVEFVAAKVTHGGLVARYALPTILGLSLVLGYLLPRLGNRVLGLVAVFVGCALILQEGGFWLSWRSGSSEDAQFLQNSIGAVRTAAQLSELPVVISNGVEYLEFVYYAPADLAKRATFVSDASASSANAGNDTVDKQLLLLRALYPLRVEEFPSFAMSHRQFLLSAVSDSYDWQAARLAKDGHFVELVSSAPGHKIYFVDLDRSH
jgi:4-amino-4-deoxy-L-arabinose transferase-like glycosyltransferase